MVKISPVFTRWKLHFLKPLFNPHNTWNTQVGWLTESYTGLLLSIDTNLSIWLPTYLENALHCKVGLLCFIVLLYFKYCILGGANTYLSDIFYKIKYWMFQSFVSDAMIILQRNNQKTITTTYKEFLGTCITYKHSYLKRKAYIHYASACKNVSN